MCQMRIILKERDREKTILDSAAAIKVTDKGVLVNALFEPPKLVEGASLLEMDFLSSTVTLTKGKNN